MAKHNPLFRHILRIMHKNSTKCQSDKTKKCQFMDQTLNQNFVKGGGTQRQNVFASENASIGQRAEQTRATYAYQRRGLGAEHLAAGRFS